MEKNKRRVRLKQFGLLLFSVLIFATPITIFTSHFFDMVGSLFYQKEKVSNYSSLFPFPTVNNLSKEWFVIFCLFSVLLYSLFSYLCEAQAERLIIKVNSYLKNCLLKKFRCLKFEDRLKKKEEISGLVEIESNLVAEH